MLDLDAVKRMSVSTTASKTLLDNALRYLRPETFEGLCTSRTIKATQLSRDDVQRAVEMGKFEPIHLETDAETEAMRQAYPLTSPGRRGAGRADAERMNQHPASERPTAKNRVTLPPGFHGVNVFAVPELKGRRRLITEPHLNAAIAKHEMPKLHYPSRLQRRQSLRHAKYMLQIDFEAYYDAIPIPETIRNNFVFRSRGGDGFFRLCTLPTGARWSVAVAQAITNVIVDVDTPVLIDTMIDNIMVAAREGQEIDFLRTVRLILDRIREANLLTSPDREELASETDEELLERAMKRDVFLGEEYGEYDGEQRWVRNAPKTVAKIKLSLQLPRFTCRSFVSVISLILFALHTTGLNPAQTFRLLRAYRGVYRQVSRGKDWDEELSYLDSRVHQELLHLGSRLVENRWEEIANVRHPTYEEDDYDVVCFTDACVDGWGAVVRWYGHPAGQRTTSYQQRWVHDLGPRASWGRGGPSQGEALHHTLPPRFVRTGEGRWLTVPPEGEPPSTHQDGAAEPVDTAQYDNPKGYFRARFSAHSEPRAAHLMLKHLVEKEGLPNGSRIALITDHFAIVHAQRKLNGYGGIGRGYALNRLFEYVHDLWTSRGVDVVFFYVTGVTNPADDFSRNFGVRNGRNDLQLTVANADHLELPSIKSTFSPLCEEAGSTGSTRNQTTSSPHEGEPEQSQEAHYGVADGL